jgi:pimeloyl-ACP methyl ester carboxylesterase
MEIETTRGRFDVIDEGKGTTTLVLVHGFPVDADAWRADAKALSSRMRVIAPSMRGFGGSQQKGVETLSIEGMADDVAAIVAALDVPGPIVIGGLSMGGYVAMAFARKYAEVLRGVILADTRAEPDSDEARANRDKAIATVEGGDLAGFVNGLVESALSPATRAERPAVVDQVRGLMMKAKPASVTSALKALRDRPDATPELGAISVPVLVVVGEDDTVTPLAAAKAMIAAMPETRTQLVVIPKAGHISNLEQPDAFRKAVTGFVATL